MPKTEQISDSSHLSSSTSGATATESSISNCFNCNANEDHDHDHQRRICCVGMCVLDIIHVCVNYPIEDTDKRCLDGRMQRGGNASNMCTVLRSLNYDNVEFLGMMSTAKGFEFLRSDCEERKIHFENCPTVAQNPPFSSVILVANTDSRTIIHSNSNFPIFTYQHFAMHINSKLQNYCWFHFEARNWTETLCMQRDITAYNQTADNPIIISVEFEKLSMENFVLALAADYIFVGKELASHMDWHDPKQAAYGLLNWLVEARKAPNLEEWQRRQMPTAIICPWGALGVGILNDKQIYSFIPAKTSAKIVDALGAGDTFCAATIFAVQHLRLPIEQAVEFGNKTAGLKLSQYGYDGLASKLDAPPDN